MASRANERDAQTSAKLAVSLGAQARERGVSTAEVLLTPLKWAKHFVLKSLLVKASCSEVLDTERG